MPTPKDPDTLVGRWRKITEDPCADRYPLQLDVRAGGIYLSEGDPKAFCLWQSGDWELTDEGRLKIQIANDKMVSYRVELEQGDSEGDTLRVTDAEGCEFRYRKVSG